MSLPLNYYESTSSSKRTFIPIKGTNESNICIIGGGFAGLMTALGLVERGIKDIVILEQHHIGWGASGRNGGFVFGGYSLGPQALVNQVGLEQARALYKHTIHAVDLIRNRVKNYGIECDLVDQGVILAHWFKEQRSLKQLQSFMNKNMLTDWEYLSPDLLSEKIKSDRYCGGLFEPNAMHFHPLNYAKGIAKVLSDAGVKIYEQSPVLKINDRSLEKIVETPGGAVKSKHLVVTGGGYIGKTYPALSNSILPIATYVMVTEPLGDNLNQYINTKAAIYDTRFAFDYYRPLNDTRILWGGRISAKTREPLDLKEKLRKDLSKVFPELQDIGVDFVWQGYMGYARHQMAQIGRLPNGVWYSNGFGGHGVAPTTAAGEIIAAAIVENDTTFESFSNWKLPWNGGPFGPVAAQLSYWWYQSRDWLKEAME